MDYQGNRNRDKEPKEEKPDKVVVKVVTGEVIQKQNTMWRKFRDIFFGGDAKSTMRYVIADVLYPGFRDIGFDVFSKGAERMFYGDNGRARRPSYEGRVQYNRYSHSSNPLDRGRYSPPTARLPDQNPGWQKVNKQRVGDVVVFSKEEAETVVSTLIDIIDQYEVASIADYYELLGLESTAIDNKWGWSYLNNVQIRQTRQGYVIDLPPAEEL